MEKILFENILKILEQFWVSYKVTKKFLQECGCNIREILQKFLENFQIQKMLKLIWNDFYLK